MAYFHVITKLVSGEHPICLFDDLSSDDLRAKFLRHYERGQDFLAGGNVISAKDIRSVRIIETNRDNATEREEINRRSRAKIDELNSSSDSVFFISLGNGYEPDDIAEAGEDVTSVYIKGPPGYALATSLPALAPAASSRTWYEHAGKALIALVVTLVAAGIIYKLGWI